MFEYEFRPRARLPALRDALRAFGCAYLLGPYLLLLIGVLHDQPVANVIVVVLWGVAVAVALLIIGLLLTPWFSMLLRAYVARVCRRKGYGITIDESEVSLIVENRAGTIIPRDYLHECVYRRVNGELDELESGFGLNFVNIDELGARISPGEKSHMLERKEEEGFHVWVPSIAIGTVAQNEEFIATARERCPKFREEIVFREPAEDEPSVQWTRMHTLLAVFATLIYGIFVVGLIGYVFFS